MTENKGLTSKMDSHKENETNCLEDHNDVSKKDSIIPKSGTVRPKSARPKSGDKEKGKPEEMAPLEMRGT